MISDAPRLKPPICCADWRVIRATRTGHSAPDSADRLHREAGGVGAFDEVEQPPLAGRMGEGEAAVDQPDEPRPLIALRGCWRREC
jgi:hypothetical protein